MATFQHCAFYSQEAEPLARHVGTAWNISTTPSAFWTRCLSLILDFTLFNNNNVVDNQFRCAKHPEAKVGLGYSFPMHVGALQWRVDDT
jgi:hypothetical protein